MGAGETPRSTFDEDVVARTADRFDLAVTTLRDLLDRHQASVEAFPGVDELVYEWRKHFDGAILERTDRAYYLSAPAWVWDEFGDHLDTTDAELSALVATHRVQARSRPDVDDVADGRSFVVLRRQG